MLQMFPIFTKNQVFSKNYSDFKSDGSYIKQIVANTQWIHTFLEFF